MSSINPESLSKEEVLEKIKYLSLVVHNSIMNHGTEKFCLNRINRIQVLKTYL